jgi:hypothetical protein
VKLTNEELAEHGHPTNSNVPCGRSRILAKIVCVQAISAHFGGLYGPSTIPHVSPSLSLGTENA